MSNEVDSMVTNLGKQAVGACSVCIPESLFSISDQTVFFCTQRTCSSSFRDVAVPKMEGNSS